MSTANTATTTEAVSVVFDWHGGAITRATAVDAHYRNTQNVRRFLVRACGDAFKFDRNLMAWIRSGEANTMGDVADEWLRRAAGR